MRQEYLAATPTALQTMIIRTNIPIKINNSRPKLLLFIFILLVTEKKRKTNCDFFVIYDMYSKCIQKVFSF